MSTALTTSPLPPAPEGPRGPAPRPAARAAGSAHRAGPGVALHRVALSEWTKMRSLRSTWLALGLTVLIGLGLAAAIGANLSGPGAGSGNGGGPPPNLAADHVAAVLAGSGLASLVLGVLGALQVSGEYATGTISASITAVPRRWPLLLAKAAVLVAVVAPLALAVSAASLWIGSLVVSGGLAFAWGPVLGNTAYLTAVALLGLGLAAVVRSTAISITLLVAVAFVLPPLLPLLPWSWVTTAAEYFPSAAGQSLSATVATATSLSTPAAGWTLAAWVVLPLAAGAVLLRRRDA